MLCYREAGTLNEMKGKPWILISILFCCFLSFVLVPDSYAILVSRGYQGNTICDVRGQPNGMMETYPLIEEDFLDQFQILWSGGISVAPPDLLAQSFKPSENMVSRIELLVHKTHEPLDNLTISIRETLDGPDLTKASLPPQAIPESRGWVEFDFNDVPVLINTTYYILWQPQGESMAYIWWGYDNHNYDSYPRGEAWLYTNGQWATEGFVIKDWCFRTYAYHLSQPPFPPAQPRGPAKGISQTTYQYQASTSDPDGDEVRYGWDWDGDDVVDEWTTWYDSGVMVNVSHAWSSLGMYAVQVKAEDTYGFMSNFSESLMVTIANDPPLIPGVPVGPVVGLSFEEYEYRVNTSDPDGDEVRYGWDWDGAVSYTHLRAHET